MLLAMSSVFAIVPNTFAQDTTKWHLPEGAKKRLGKGTLHYITLRVVLEFGSMTGCVKFLSLE